ncbi:MAG TPA: EAL domain-containing protein [Mycobacteriales bacterium]|nr:EAL domain-containing protein [Mycobacteriales bacterium]
MTDLDHRPANPAAQDWYADFQPVFADDLTTVVGYQSLLRSVQDPVDVQRLFATDDVDLLTQLNLVATQVALRDCPPLPEGGWLMVKVDAPVGRRTVLALARALTAAGVKHAQLLVEVRFTDQGGARAAEVLATLAAARAQGMRTAVAAVDGWRSLRPFLVAADVVKLDRRLLDDRDPRKADEVVAATRGGGLPLLAFGVESAADVDAARRLGVDWLQGRHLAPPSRHGQRRA